MSIEEFKLVEHDINEFLKYTEARKELLEYPMKPFFDKYSPIYTFTTENLDSYLNTLNIQDKSCLTVTSSGDQIINLALLGASKIDCFDTNRIAEYYTRLKLAALQELKYEEFIDYFTNVHAVCPNTKYIFLDNDECFSYSLYMKFYNFLDEKTRLFFDSIYSYFKYDNTSIVNTFYNVSDDRAKYNNTYLKNKENYYKARELTKKITDNGINYSTLDIFDITKLSNKYDLVLLSNIYDYLGGKKDIYAKYVLDDVSNIVNPEGNILLHYQYGYRQRKDMSIRDNLAIYVNSDDTRYFNISEIRELSNKEFTLIGVPSIYRNNRYLGVEDCAYVYKKM